MIELHMNFVPVYFIIMDMRINTSSPIMLGRPFLRTICAVIDSKEVYGTLSKEEGECSEVQVPS
jgi:hypothetical protein